MLQNALPEYLQIIKYCQLDNQKSESSIKQKLEIFAVFLILQTDT